MEVVLCSGGMGSAEVLLRAVKLYGLTGVKALFTDTLEEDKDLYRFLVELISHINGDQAKPKYLLNLVDNLAPYGQHTRRRATLIHLANQVRSRYPWFMWIAEGRTVWELFRDEKFIGNTRVDVCSRVLKRDISHKVIANLEGVTGVHLGIDWSEVARYDKAKPHWLPYELKALLVDDFNWTKGNTETYLSLCGIRRPRLYDLGFPHNNCGGRCTKAGMGQYKILQEKLPEHFDQLMLEEEKWQRVTGKNNTILRLQRTAKRTARPMSLREFKGYRPGMKTEEIQDIGGCGCMLS